MDSESTPSATDKKGRAVPLPVVQAQRVLEILSAEDAGAAEKMAKILPGFAMQLAKAGEEVSVEALLEHASLGPDHLASYRPAGQKPLVYAEVISGLKPLPTEDKESIRPRSITKRPLTYQILRAAKHGHMDLARQLIDAGAPLDRAGREGHQPIILASQHGHVDIIRLILEKGISPDQANKKNQTALIWSSWFNYPEVVSFLLEKGADPNKADFMGCNPVMVAAQAGNLDIMRMLLDRGAIVDEKTARAALRMAAKGGHGEIMNLLIEKGASLSDCSAKEKIPYQEYCRGKNHWLETVRIPPPDGLFQQNPAYFKGTAFTAIQKMLATEGCQGSKANRRAFAGAALFGSEQRVLQYLEKWGQKQGQPLYELLDPLRAPLYVPNEALNLALENLKNSDIARQMSLSVKIDAVHAPAVIDVDTKLWGDAVLKCGPGMSKLFRLANKMLPQKTGDGRTWSYLITQEKISAFAYKRAGEHPELAKLCFKFDMQEKAFNECLELVKHPEKNLPKDLPEIVLDGKVFGMEGTEFHKLPEGDIRALVMGHLVNNCQSIGSTGGSCAAHGFTSRQGGFYVVEKGHEILGETWAWRGKKGELVFDSLETLGERVSSRQWRKLVEAFSKALEREPGNVRSFRIGAGGATPDNLSRVFNVVRGVRPPRFNGYLKDSRRQIVVWRQKKSRKP